jgi:hypothetical protein
LGATFLAAQRRLDAHPVTATMAGSQGKVNVLVDAGAFVRAVRAMLTDNHSDQAPQIPLAITEALGGDVHIVAGILAGTIAPNEDLCVGYRPKCGASKFDAGPYLTSMCRDEVPFVDPSRLAAAAAGDPGMGEAFGDPPILDLCRGWNVSQGDGRLNVPVRSNVPTLVATGAYDAYSSMLVARWAVTAGLSHAFIYEVSFYGHNVHHTAAAVEIRNAWIEQPMSAPGLGPLDNLREPPFILPG